MQLLEINYQLLNWVGTIIGGGALGGVISVIVNRRENKRIKVSEAAQSEATARREDASAATQMMGLLERTVSHMEKMNSYNERRITDLEKAFERELERRKFSDYHFCDIVDCKLRKPPLGTFIRERVK